MKVSEKEMEQFATRTPKSKAALQRGKQYFPLGVTSNFRYYPPHPIFVERGRGSRLWDVDGNEYIDFNMSFGVLFTGHAHPDVLKAVTEQIQDGTMFGMPGEFEQKLAAELISRFRIDRIRFANSGTEATMHAIRVARG